MKSIILAIISFGFVFAQNSPAQDNPYPNELKGFEFFKREKIKKLRLTISTKEDVIRIFGKDCENFCEYSDDWRISFTYFDNIYFEITENGKKTKYVPDAKYSGRLYSIKFIPKKSVSFAKVSFSPQFKKSFGNSVGHDFSGNARSISYDSYTDSYGLRYVIFEGEDYTTFDEKDERRSGDLISIEYFIPEKREEKMFVKQ